MYKTNPLLIEKCRRLRRNGFTLGEIVSAVKLPKTTVYDQVHNIVFSIRGRIRIKATKEKVAEENTKRINQ